jgi:hypothetical protein
MPMNSPRRGTNDRLLFETLNWQQNAGRKF